MPVKALNVAEKPSVAKEVSRILSNGQARSRRGRYGGMQHGQLNQQWHPCQSSCSCAHPTHP